MVPPARVAIREFVQRVGVPKRESIDVGEDGEIGFTLATGDREPHRLLERVGGTEQQLDDFVGGSRTAAPEVVEQILEAM